MKSICQSLTQKIFIIPVLLSFAISHFSFAKTNSPTETETSLQQDRPEQAIWNILHPEAGNGTGFFIEPNLFVTNFHVVSAILSGSRSFTDISLSQEGNDSVLKIKKIIAVSASHDLALLETEKPVTNYLRLRENPLIPSEKLFLIAYPSSAFIEIKKTGDIFYEDDRTYSFPTDNSSMMGASGGPVLDEQRQVAGVAFRTLHNLLHTIKTNHLQELIAGNIGIRCDELLSTVVSFFNKECIKKEIERLKQLAEEGSMYAQNRLAYAYHHGTAGIDPNINEAIKWYTRAAEQGYALAQRALGIIYDTSEGVKRDIDKAIKWHSEAMKQGLISSQVSLADIYINDLETEKDIEKALQLIKEAAEKKYAVAQGLFGSLYQEGERVEMDMDEAVKWYTRAAEQGQDMAQYTLGTIYHIGEGVEMDMDEAVKWYTRAAEQGHESALAMLVLLNWVVEPDTSEQEAVWRISGFKHNKDGNGEFKSYRNGTGFFVGTNHFITNFHVISSMLSGSGSLEDITLSQEGTLFQLKIKKVIAVSASYDLALLETKEPVTNYLNLRENPPEPNEKLSLIAYPGGEFTKIHKTGDIFYEDDQSYSFPTDNSSMKGANGSPILDDQGQVVGVTFGFLYNLLQAIKVDHLQEFINGNIGINCARSVSVVVRFFNKECIKKEIERLKQLAEEGSPYAQYELARRYESGDEMLDLNIYKAMSWYRKSAEQGYALAQHVLGSIYLIGEKVKRNIDETIKWYDKAAQQGFISSQSSLAAVYNTADMGIEKNPEKVLQLAKEPAETGYVLAQTLLGNMYYEGDGVEKDFEQSSHWYEKAAEQGHAESQILLAWMYLYGEGVEQNNFEAIKWYTIAATQGHPIAKFALRVLLFSAIMESLKH